MFEFKEGCTYTDTYSMKYHPEFLPDTYLCVRRTPKTISLQSLKGFDRGIIYPRQKIRYDNNGNEFIWIYSRPCVSGEIKAEYLVKAGELEAIVTMNTVLEDGLTVKQLAEKYGTIRENDSLYVPIFESCKSNDGKTINKTALKIGSPIRREKNTSYETYDIKIDTDDFTVSITQTNQIVF